MARIASEEIYADLTSAVDAQHRGSQFSIIDLGQGGKIDLIFLKQDAFDRAAFQRRRSIATDAGVFFFQSPEDSILSKLRWSRLCGGSERQLADVAGVMATQWPTLDLQYLRFWAKELGVDGEFEDILAESKLMWPEGTA